MSSLSGPGLLPNLSPPKLGCPSHDQKDRGAELQAKVSDRITQDLQLVLAFVRRWGWRGAT
eukprot:4401540-Karenia_brevis.AAC.1